MGGESSGKKRRRKKTVKKRRKKNGRKKELVVYTTYYVTYLSIKYIYLSIIHMEKKTRGTVKEEYECHERK